MTLIDLYARYRRMLVTVVWRKCDNWEQAEDLVQDTFAELVSQPPLAEVNVAYIMQRLNWRLTDYGRYASRHPATLPLLPEVLPDEAHPQQLGTEDRLDLDHKLQLALREPALRELLHLLLLDDDTPRSATFQQRVKRARRRLRAALAADEESLAQALGPEARNRRAHTASASPHYDGGPLCH